MSRWDFEVFHLTLDFPLASFQVADQFDSELGSRPSK